MAIESQIWPSSLRKSIPSFSMHLLRLPGLLNARRQQKTWRKRRSRAVA
jgi:hypothetical protein